MPGQGVASVNAREGAVVGVADVQETVNIQASVSGTYTIPDVTVATVHRLTVTGTTTLVLPVAAAGKSITVAIAQDATGSRAVTLPTAKWAAATAPTLSTAASKVDVLTFACVDGTNWFGFVAGLDMR